jgi:hypothetical protein
MADEQPFNLNEWLYQASISPDESMRAVAAAAAKKLTPEEGRAFYDYQKQLHAPPSKTTSVLGVPITMVGDQPRADSNIIGADNGVGIAPEDALMGGMAIKGIARAANATGAVAGVKAAASVATPLVKYKIYKGGLEKAGVPPSIADMIAMTAVGYPMLRNARLGATPAPAAAAEAAPAAAEVAPKFALSAEQQAARQRVLAQNPNASGHELTTLLNTESRGGAYAPAGRPPGWPEPAPVEAPAAAPVPDNNVASPAAKAAVPVIRNMTTEQFQAVSKLPVEERQLYIRLRQVGDSHAEAIRTLDYSRETQALREQAQTARAMVGKEKAASDLFGSSSPEAQQKLLELAPGPSRRPLAGEVAGLDARFKAMLADPKAAYILPFLGGTLGAAARRERGAE